MHCNWYEYLHDMMIWIDEYTRALQESAERLYDSFQALGPEGGFLPPSVARDVVVKTGLEKEQLRQIWNLSDIDRDGYLDRSIDR